MMKSSACFELIESLTRAGTVEEIHDVCSDLCERLGFNHFIYGARLPTSFVRPYICIISGYPTDWWEHYKNHGYLKMDPLVLYCAGHTAPLIWDSLPDPESLSDQSLRIMEEARDFGLKSGASFPLHSAQGEFALLGLAMDQEPEHARSHIVDALPFAQLLTTHIHEAVRRIVDIQEIRSGKAQLTQREKECLLWAAEGKTSWETAQILNISERTVIFHLQNAAAKLNVCSRQQAVARAISMGLISPQIG